MTKHFDVIVIGSGPGGEGAAMKATKGGKRVAICDNLNKLRWLKQQTLQPEIRQGCSVKKQRQTITLEHK